MEGLDSSGEVVVLPGAPGAQARVARAEEKPGPIAAALAAKRQQEQQLPVGGGEPAGFTDVFVDLPAGAFECVPPPSFAGWLSAVPRPRSLLPTAEQKWMPLLVFWLFLPVPSNRTYVVGPGGSLPPTGSGRVRKEAGGL
jgi:hypothetical protein